MRAVALLTLQTMLQVAQAQSLYGPSSCTTPDDFERLVEQVETNCCDQFDQQNNCDGSGIPAVCDTRCVRCRNLNSTRFSCSTPASHPSSIFG